jgi:hypothetical protein
MVCSDGEGRPMRGPSGSGVGQEQQRSLVLGLVLTGACFFAIRAEAQTAQTKSPALSVPPQNEVKAICHYVPADPKIAMRYHTTRDQKTGVISIDAEKVTAKPLEINFQKEPSSAEQPIEKILVSLLVTYKKAKGKYVITPDAAPVLLDREGESYTVKLDDFVKKLAAEVNSMLPATFDPNATDPDFKATAEVTITPVLSNIQAGAADVKGESVKLSQSLTLAFELGLGEPEKADAERGKPKAKGPAKE